MDRSAWLELLAESLETVGSWEERWGGASVPPPSGADREALDALAERLVDGNYPFFHPAYAGQMLKPPHPVAWAAYATAMAINPNNHALDGGPPTAEMEREVVADLARLFGFEAHLGHLSASGTIANLEALWVAREVRGPHRVAICKNAHYTHGRMAGLLGLETVEVQQTALGTMNIRSLEAALATGDVGTVVVTLGTTGLGAIDPLHEILPLAQAVGARVHVDAAYGGFFALLGRRSPALVDPRPFEALAQVESIVVDPHKHGLQPYGCGCVIFSDPGVGTVYKHESPYTYFTSQAHHLGEITLECSRAGASAAALWTTLRAMPLSPNDGLGESLAAGRRAALAWAAKIEAEPCLRLVVEPMTDVLCFAPTRSRGGGKASVISGWTEAVFRAGMIEGDGAFFLAKLRLSQEQGSALWPDIEWDADEVVVLRSALIKPEHEAWIARLHDRVVAAAQLALAGV